MQRKHKPKKDTKLSRNIVIRPLLYTAITIVLAAWDSGKLGWFSIIPILFIIVGYPIGYLISSGTKVRKGLFGELYYRRSTVTLAVWIIVLVIRIYAEFTLPASFGNNLFVDSLFGFIAGILVGEVRLIVIKARKLLNRIENLPERI